MALSGPKGTFCPGAMASRHPGPHAWKGCMSTLTDWQLGATSLDEQRCRFEGGAAMPLGGGMHPVTRAEIGDND